MKNRYHNLHISKDQKDLLKLLDEEEIDIFTFSEIETRLGVFHQNLSNILLKLVHHNLLVQFEKGKYCRPNFNNQFVIANYLCKGSAIAYWSALNHHGLTEQIPNTVFSQTDKLKTPKKVFNVNYRFVKVHPRKMVGITTRGRGSHAFRVTDIEKTIIDCFDLPRYSGGFSELVRAFYHARLNKHKLLAYAVAVDNLSVFKRISYLAELFEMKGFKTFQKETRHRLKEKYTNLSPGGRNTGKHLSKWKLCLNVDEKTVLSMVKKEY
jgi:predicted transcriptional regulator of viral defense system